MAKPQTLEEFVAIVAKQRFAHLQFRHVAELEPEAVMNMDSHPGVIFCGSAVWKSLQELPDVAKTLEASKQARELRHIPLGPHATYFKEGFLAGARFVKESFCEMQNYALPSMRVSPATMQRIGMQVHLNYKDAVKEAEQVGKQLDEASRKRHEKTSP